MSIVIYLYIQLSISIFLFLIYLFYFLILLFTICVFCSVAVILLHCGSFWNENKFTFTFMRHFYPKRLTVHSGYTFFLSVCVFPGNWTHDLFCAANAMLYHWATGTLFQIPRMQRWVVTSYIYFVTFTWVHFLGN